MGNLWRKRGIQDGEIDWRMSGWAIYNLIRALAKPYPGAHFYKNGVMVKVWKAEILFTEHLKIVECGKILAVKSDTEFYIKVYDSVIHVLT